MDEPSERQTTDRRTYLSRLGGVAALVAATAGCGMPGGEEEEEDGEDDDGEEEGDEDGGGEEDGEDEVEGGEDGGGGEDGEADDALAPRDDRAP